MGFLSIPAWLSLIVLFHSTAAAPVSLRQRFRYNRDHGGVFFSPVSKYILGMCFTDTTAAPGLWYAAGSTIWWSAATSVVTCGEGGGGY